MILLIWLTVVIIVNSYHEVWRDEVRALSATIEPASIWQLPSTLKYEGHPLLWYLMLRIAFFVMYTPVAVKVIGICTAFADAAEFKKAIGDENYEVYLLNQQIVKQDWRTGKFSGATWPIVNSR